MKAYIKYLTITLLAACISITACDSSGASDSDGSSSLTFENADTAGQIITVTADSVTFKAVYVPGGFTFHTGCNDEGTASLASPYWIGETEVTYQLWQKVYDWATDAARGANRYTFANAGEMGFGTGCTDQHPVTTISWRDAMIWCNALTEWYNAQTGTVYQCVYTSSGSVIRDSGDSSITACDSVSEDRSVKGFRLLSWNEWELAARYRDGMLWTYGDHTSGDDSGACFDDFFILGGMGLSTVFGDYCVYEDNSGNSTAAVKSKKANALGIYDMSGNVREWGFDLVSNPFRILVGGYYEKAPHKMRVGAYDSCRPETAEDGIGFRIAKTK